MSLMDWLESSQWVCKLRRGMPNLYTEPDLQLQPQGANEPSLSDLLSPQAQKHSGPDSWISPFQLDPYHIRSDMQCEPSELVWV